MRCNDAVNDIGPRSFLITEDLKTGYWQVLVHKASREKTAFFVRDGKKHWNRMLMGARNAHSFFVAMILEMKKEWTEDYQNKGVQLIRNVIHMYLTLTPPEFLHKVKEMSEANPEAEFLKGDPTSVAIVDDILWASNTVLSLLAFFAMSLLTFQHYSVSFNLQKCRFLPTRTEFVGFDMLTNGNSPAKSKYVAIGQLMRPVLFSDLLMFIGLLGLYSKWLVLYEIRISRWRGYLRKRPIVKNEKEEEEKLLTSLWKDQDKQLFHALKQKILEGPILKRPDYDRRFYDWSQAGMGGALCQPECEEDEEQVMLREIEGGKCELDKTISGLRLRAIETIARACKGSKTHEHSSKGEPRTG
jgi:hypothetical protein